MQDLWTTDRIFLKLPTMTVGVLIHTYSSKNFYFIYFKAIFRCMYFSGGGLRDPMGYIPVLQEGKSPRSSDASQGEVISGVAEQPMVLLSADEKVLTLTRRWVLSLRKRDTYYHSPGSAGEQPEAPKKASGSPEAARQVGARLQTHPPDPGNWVLSWCMTLLPICIGGQMWS